MQVSHNSQDKILLSIIWAISLAATLYVAYFPPSEPEVLRTMMTLVTSILSALLILMNVTRAGGGDGKGQ